MSFWKIYNYLQNFAAQNENIQKAMENLCAEIERDQNLRQEEEATFQEMFQLQTELESLCSVAEQLQNEREQRSSIAEALTLAHQSSEQLGEQLRRIDYQKLAGYQVLVNDRQRQQKWKEMEEESKQRQEMLNQLENRHIVQRLRLKQAELQAAEKELEESKKKKQRVLAEGLSKLRTVQLKRNEIILNLVKSHKEREALKEEHKILSDQRQELEQLRSKKSELQAQLQKLQKSLNPCEFSQAIETEAVFKQPPPVKTLNTDSDSLLATNTSAQNSFSPADIDPMSFLTSINLNFNISAAMELFYSDMQAENQQKAATKLRPILRTSNKPYDNNNQLQQENNNLETSVAMEIRHVSFVKSESSRSCSPASIQTDDNDKDAGDDDDDNKQEQQPIARDIKNAEKVEVIDLLTPSGAVSPTILTAAELSSEDTDMEIYEERVKIIECKVVKPAGTALPKTLPTNLTASPIEAEVIHESVAPPVQNNQAPPDQSNQTPMSTTAVSKAAPMKVEDKSLNTSATIEAFINQHSIQAQPIKALISEKQAPKSSQSIPKHKSQSHLDFDSFFISNAYSDTDENEYGLLNNSPMFDFDGSTDRMKNDDVEQEKLIDFSDNDGARNNNDFF